MNIVDKSITGIPDGRKSPNNFLIPTIKISTITYPFSYTFSKPKIHNEWIKNIKNYL